MQVIDLFAGAGGLGLGARLAGYRLVGSVDMDSEITASHETNLPGCPLLLADLSRTSAKTLVERLQLNGSEIDGIVGGPPCQGFSHIGQRDPGDPRNALVGRFFYYVESLRPQFFLFENVPGILSLRAGKRLEDHLSKIARNYTVFGPTILDAADFGAATHRKRAFVVGFLAGVSGGAGVLDAPALPGTSVRDAISDVPSPSTGEANDTGWTWGPYRESDDPVSTYAQTLRALPPPNLGSPTAAAALERGCVSGIQATRHTPAVERRFAALEPGARDQVSRFPRLRWDRPSPTLRAGTGTERGSFQAVRPIHPTAPRVITVREGARLQGFPDWFQFHRTKWHSFRMIGNSVSPIVAAKVLSNVRRILEGSRS